jgi:flagellar biosynthesis chaperone FliJ
MTDPNEPIEERLKRLEAEAAELRKKLAEVTEQRDNYRDAVHDYALKEWEGFTQADLDAAINNPVTLQTFIDQLEREAKRG